MERENVTDYRIPRILRAEGFRTGRAGHSSTERVYVSAGRTSVAWRRTGTNVKCKTHLFWAAHQQNVLVQNVECKVWRKRLAALAFSPNVLHARSITFWCASSNVKSGLTSGCFRQKEQKKKKKKRTPLPVRQGRVHALDTHADDRDAAVRRVRSTGPRKLVGRVRFRRPPRCRGT